MRRFRFWAISISSFISVTALTGIQQSLSATNLSQNIDNLPNSLRSQVDIFDNRNANPSQSNPVQVRQFDLSGEWIYETRYVEFIGNCTGIERDHGVNGQSAFNIIQNGNRLIVSGRYAERNGLSEARLSGNQFTALSTKFSNFRLEGTVSSDGNTITGTVFCTINKPFTLTRKIPTPPPPQPVSPQTIEEKRAFRKSDQQVAAELAALRERGRREGWSFQVGDSQAFRILLEVLTGTRIPQNFRPSTIDILSILSILIQDSSRNYPPPTPPQPTPVPGQLPSRFDAREWNVVPEIRSQGTCGSCWAFAAVSANEIAYSSRYQQPNSNLNLSEQQLLSCNRQGFSCNGGFVTDKDSDYRYESGLVGEQIFPYQGQDSPCRAMGRPSSGNLYDIKAFDFVLAPSDNPGSSASITKIKQAIYVFGSVWAGVYADDAFQAYKGGIFNSCNNSRPNHAINIIGWDDAGGYWIARNSWGNDWGENGYFKIKYGCSQIGVSAAVPKLPQLLDCAGGNCQQRNSSPPPWLRGVVPNPVPPAPVPPTPVPPAPVPTPPSNTSPQPLW